MMNECVLIEGIAGFVQTTHERRFALDYSQFSEIVRSSYESQITLDRGLKRHLSFSMFQYYCTIMFWKRIYTVLASRGSHTIEELRLHQVLPESTPLPIDVATYLNGVGDLTDESGRRFHLDLHSDLTDLEIGGVKGTFNRVDVNTHLAYETMPSPMIAILKIIADMRRTALPQADGPVQWDLPEGLRPDNEEALLPTPNLLGWSRAVQLTDFQRQALEDAGFTAAADDFQVTLINVGNLPVNQQLMAYVGQQLESSKVRAITTMATTPNGSMAQMPYTTRSPQDAQYHPDTAISSKGGITNSYCQTNSYTASGSAIMRYRLQRRIGQEDDMVCYTFVDQAIPGNWLAGENQVFEHGAFGHLWNTAQFRLSEQNGRSLACSFAQRVREKFSR